MQLRSHPPRSDQQQALHARIAVLADDDVVVDGDAERLGGVDDLFGHFDVGTRRRRVARGMVVQLPLP